MWPFAVARGNMKLSIIIPVYAQWQLTKACLASLAEHTPFPAEVIVVDNASSDETPAACPVVGKNLFGDRFVYLRFETNRNFAGGCNAGALAATGTHLFFLNNDTLLTENWFPPLARTLEEPQHPLAVGPLLLYPEFFGEKDRIQHLGVAFTPQMHVLHPYEGFPASHPLCAKPRYCRTITGAALLVSQKAFMNAGMFDEAFINGGEDIEFCLRLISRGGLVACTPQSRIYHLVGQTPGRHAHETHNAKVLMEKALKRIVPDLHLFAAQDGYRLALTPGLKPYMDLPERRKNLLAKQTERLASVDDLESLLEKEPLCHAAYAKLADLYRASGNHQTAAQRLALALHFRPHPVTAEMLQHAAIAAQDKKLAAHAADILEWYATKDFEELRETAAFIASYTKDAGMPELTKLYSRWLDAAEENRRWFGKH